MKMNSWYILTGIIIMIILAAVVVISIPVTPVQNAGTGAGYGQGPGYGQAQSPDPGAGTGPGSYYPTLLPAPGSASLSDIEIAGILFMREEEQMAHDLYIRWEGMTRMPVFSNIAEAETMHMYEVQLLIDRYGLQGERIGNASAGYTSPVIQSLYDSFSVQGDSSLTSALESGLAGEERDIADLDLAMGNTTRPDILQVYANLRQGSENHRRGFLRALGR